MTRHTFEAAPWVISTSIDRAILTSYGSGFAFFHAVSNPFTVIRPTSAQIATPLAMPLTRRGPLISRRMPTTVMAAQAISSGQRRT
ncbi:hypothetical protein [Thermobispora bispora]|uniref:hypothetical protein n=1 Tax=Thermobispora bispora TaxID=2006 RepID=UPI003341C969